MVQNIKKRQSDQGNQKDRSAIDRAQSVLNARQSLPEKRVLYTAGDSVELIHENLVFNGVRGIIIKFIEKRNRYRVQLDGCDRAVNVLAANLIPFVRSHIIAEDELKRVPEIVPSSKRNPENTKSHDEDFRATNHPLENVPPAVQLCRTVSGQKRQMISSAQDGHEHILVLKDLNGGPREIRNHASVIFEGDNLPQSPSCANGDTLPDSDIENSVDLDDEEKYLAALHEGKEEIDESDYSDEEDEPNDPLKTEEELAQRTECTSATPEKLFPIPPQPKMFLAWKKKNGFRTSAVSPSLPKTPEEKEVTFKDGERDQFQVATHGQWEIRDGMARKVKTTSSLLDLQSSKKLKNNPFLMNDRSSRKSKKRRN